MHCRLKLDELVESLMDLRAEKQAYLTRMELLRQGIDLTWLEEDDFLAKTGGAWCRASWARRLRVLKWKSTG